MCCGQKACLLPGHDFLLFNPFLLIKRSVSSVSSVFGYIQKIK
jgi:hypothetical protein